MNKPTLKLLLEASLMPDTETLYFPHDSSSTAEDIEQVMALIPNARTAVDEGVEYYG